MTRRLRVYQTAVKFVSRPDANNLTEARAVDGLKSRINAGFFDKFILFFAVSLAHTLLEKFNPGSDSLACLPTGSPI